MDIRTIKERGIKLGEGRYREVYELDDYVYKIDNGTYHFSNKSEFEIFNENPSELLNPIYDICDNGKIVKVDKCVPLEKFIYVERLEKITKMYLSNVWSIFGVIKEFNLYEFIDYSIDDVKKLCDKNRLDYDEIIYPLNWAYNPNKGKLVIVDYAE